MPNLAVNVIRGLLFGMMHVAPGSYNSVTEETLPSTAVGSKDQSKDIN